MGRYKVTIQKTKTNDRDYYRITISQIVTMIDRTVDPETRNTQELPLNENYLPVNITFESMKGFVIEFIRATIPYENDHDDAYYRIFVEYYKTLCTKGIM